MVETSPANILVVDDVRLTGWAIRKGLAEQQLPFRVVASGAEARAAFRSDRFDLVFLDLRVEEQHRVGLGNRGGRRGGLGRYRERSGDPTPRFDRSGDGRRRVRA